MSVVEIILGVLLLIASIVLIIVIILQEGNQQGIGVVSGGADTFFGKSKGRTMEQKLVKFTKISAIVFFVLTLGVTIYFIFAY